VSQIAKEVENDKENNTAGRPSKLSTRDKAAIIQEIHSGRVDNAIQATQFINSIIPQSVTPKWSEMSSSRVVFTLQQRESPYVEEDTLRAEVGICKISPKLDYGGF
jgi:hypothetical protein